MILPLRVLGSASVKRISSGRASEPISLATHLRSSSLSASRGLVAGFERDEGGDGLAFEIVGTADDRGFGDFGVGDERGLDFHGAEAVAADVDDVVDAAHEPEVAVGVLARAVAGEVAAGNVGPVGLLVALGVAVDGAGHGGPGLADDEQAAASRRERSSGLRRLVTTSGWMPKKGRVAEPGLVGTAPGMGAIMMAPVSVCHQVSTMGQRLWPIFSRYHIHASGLMGSPTVPSRRSESSLCFSTYSSPHLMKARMAVGAV